MKADYKLVYSAGPVPDKTEQVGDVVMKKADLFEAKLFVQLFCQRGQTLG